MSSPLLITLCSLLLLSYLFDLSFSRTRIPPVLLLLLLGWASARMAEWFGFVLPDLHEALKLIGTVGLILIVLEGSLELELQKNKLPLVLRSFLGSLLPLFMLAFGLAWAFNFFYNCGLRLALLNAIPLCVISSAIAIPSATNLSKGLREFITYESSLSDIFGVLFFNFVLYNNTLNQQSLADFSLEFLLMLLISLVSTLVLSLLLNNISHHIKFFPIILLSILIYALSKQFHLPALLFILIFGLFLANSEKLKSIPFLNFINPEKLEQEVSRFKELLGEAAFLVRSLFFLIFGYLIQTEDVLNRETLPWSLAIMAGILILRSIQLKLSGIKLSPVLFIAPRGLISILLFLSISPDLRLPINNTSLVLQIILLSVFLLVPGLVIHKKADTNPPQKV